MERKKRIPIMKEVKPSEVEVGDNLWGWWDGVCEAWHVQSEAVKVTSSIEWPEAKGAFDMHAGKFAYTFDDKSRLLVEVKP